MSAEYDVYIREHKDNVRRGLEWMVCNIPWVMEGIDRATIMSQIYIHDDSKRWPQEYAAYDARFFGDGNAEGFDAAWLHHIHGNPHHWQHWVIPGEGPIDMPQRYIVEMVCDWWSFSWKAEDLSEIFAWYYDKGNGAKMLLSDATRTEVESILFDMSVALGLTE